MSKSSNRRTLAVLLATAAAVGPVHAEVTFEWFDIYGYVDPRPDYGRDVAVDAQGNVYATGESTVAVFEADYVTLKYDSSGVRQWERRYDGTGGENDEPRKLGLDDAGNVYVGGISWGGGDFGTGPKYDLLVIKYDADGNMIWEHRYNSVWNNDDLFSDMKVLADGTVYVGGFSYGPIGQPATAEYTTIKIDPDGQLAWSRFWDGPQDDIDYLFAALEADATGVYLAATVQIAVPGGGHGVFGAIKYDTAGNEVWSNIWSPPPPAVAGLDYTTLHDVTLDPFGNLILAGRYNTDEPTGETEGDAVLVKFDTAGQHVWSAVNSTVETDTFQHVTSDAEGNLFAAGAFNIDTGFEFHADHLTAAYTPDGDLLWEHRFGGDVPNYDGDGKTAIDGAGRLIVATRNIMGNTLEDMRLFVYERMSGAILDTASFDNGCCDWMTAMALTPQGKVVLTGHSRPDGSNAELTVVQASLGGSTLGEATQLKLGRNGGQLELSWDSACGVPEDYAIYEGTLGDFGSHTPVTCSTASATSTTVDAGPSDRYYLALPLGTDEEGSYGQDSAGNERSTSVSACRALQNVAPCP